MALPSDFRVVRRIVRYYLRYDRDNPFIFISAMLAFLGIAAGVMVLMIAMGIMNGTQKEFEKKLFVMNYPLTVVSFGRGVRRSTMEKIEKALPNVKVSPFYTTQVIVKYSDAIDGGLLYGVDFRKEAAINSVFAKAYDANRSYGTFDLIAGDDLARTLGAGIGDKITLYFSQQQAVGFGSMPLQKRFVLTGTFDSGLKAYDKAILYTGLKAFQKILKKDPDRFDGLHLYTDRPMELIDRVKALLPDDADVEGWWQQNGNFFSAMQMEKKALFLVLLMIILVASLNIVSSLLMTVMSRRKEIALLRTLGATRREIRQIFFRLGVLIGSAGIVAGTVLGFLGIWVLTHFDIITLPADVYGTSHLPVDLLPRDFFMILAGTAFIVLLSALYPARKAASTDPLKVLRNE
ncbi:FtsX-like permease family protein [Nitratifractor sp.]